MEKKKISALKVGELSDLIAKAFDGNYYCDYSLVQISKKLLFELLVVNPYQSNFEVIRNEYIQSSSDQKSPENENDFYEYICKRYLYLESEPRDNLLSFYIKATDDLKKVEEHIRYIEMEKNRLDEIKRTTGRLSGKQRYYKNQLDFFKERNQVGKDEIVDFLTFSVKAFSDSSSSRVSSLDSMSSSFLSGSMPYNYSRGMLFGYDFNKYDVRQLTEMSNKFLDFPISKYMKLREIYNTDKDTFFDTAREYISGGISGIASSSFKIDLYVNKSHIVSSRKDVLKLIDEHFKNGDYLSVVNMLPLQIEGIFHDICIAIGIDESRLDIASINEKLRIIESKFKQFSTFEYYSFKFPVIRNTVAHGKLVEGNIEHTAIMLILDLLPVCDLAMSKEIPINKKIKLIEESEGSDFKSLIELYGLTEIDIPAFYKMEKRYESVVNKYDSEEFWDYLKSEVKKEKPEDVPGSEIVKFIKKLNMSSICKGRCKVFFDSLRGTVELMKQERENRKVKVSSFIKALEVN